MAVLTIRTTRPQVVKECNMRKLYISFVVFFLAFSGVIYQTQEVFAQAADRVEDRGGFQLTGTARSAAISSWGSQTNYIDRQAIINRLGPLNEADRAALERSIPATLSAAEREALRNEARTALVQSNILNNPNSGLTPAERRAAADNAANQIANAGSCGYLAFECIIIRAVAWIAYGILWLFSWILWTTAGIFDFAIRHLAIGMGDLIVRGGFGGPIEDLWKIIRDLVNLTFVFALIYIGLSTIVKGGGAGMKDKLATVIISALLVNFSLYFAKAIIDISNVMADTIYTSILPQQGNAQGSLSAVFARHMNIDTLLVGTGGATAMSTSPEMQSLMNSTLNSWNGLLVIIMYALGSSVLIFKLAFAFAMGAFMITLRFVMLIALMIFAPVAFLPGFLPGVGSYRSQWWSTLISQAFLAPVMLFGLFLTLKIIASIPNHTGNNLSLLGLFTATGGNGGWDVAIRLLLFYVVGVVMLIGTMMMAKKMSAVGADFAQSAAGYADKKIKAGLNATMVRPVTSGAKATSSWAGRRSIGSTAKWMSGKADTNTWAGKLQRTNMLGVGRVARGIVKKGEEAKFGGNYSRKDDKEWEEKRKQSQNKADRKDEQKKKVAEYEAAKKEFASNTYLPTHWLDEKRLAAEKAVQDMTLAELEGQSVKELQKIAGLLSQKQADHIKDHKEKWTEGEKKDIKDSRETQHIEMYERDADLFLKSKKPADIAKLSKTILLNMDPRYLSGDVLRKIHDGTELSVTDASKLAARIYQADTENALIEAAGKKVAKDTRKQLIVLPADATAEEEAATRQTPNSHVIRLPRRVDTSAIKYLINPRGQGYFGRAPIDWTLADISTRTTTGNQQDSDDSEEEGEGETETRQTATQSRTSRELRREQRAEEFQQNTAQMRVEEDAARRGRSGPG